MLLLLVNAPVVEDEDRAVGDKRCVELSVTRAREDI